MRKIILLFALITIPTFIWAQDTVSVNSEIHETPISTNPSIIEHVEKWYAEHMNYATITILMAVESSFIPFPSEIVIPPAAYVAGIDGSSLNTTNSYFINVLLIILFGTLGALIGAVINYLLAMWLGRPIIYAFADSRIGHLCMLSSDKVKKAEDYFNKHGNVSTFIGRLITVIRQLISIPAGLCKMQFGWFLFYTFLGASIWNIVLALLGYVAHGQMNLIHAYSHEISIAVVALFGIAILYFLCKSILKKHRQPLE